MIAITRAAEKFLRVIVVLLLLCIFIPIAANFKQNTDKNMLVTNKEKCAGMYYVYAIDENNNEKTYIVEDSILLFKWNSHKIFYDIKVGEKYNITYQTMHIPFMSDEPNIDNAKRVFKSIN